MTEPSKTVASYRVSLDEGLGVLVGDSDSSRRAISSCGDRSTTSITAPTASLFGVAASAGARFPARRRRGACGSTKLVLQPKPHRVWAKIAEPAFEMLAQLGPRPPLDSGSRIRKLKCWHPCGVGDKDLCGNQEAERRRVMSESSLELRMPAWDCSAPPEHRYW